jgi:ketosteroid isomerase-like protein
VAEQLVGEVWAVRDGRLASLDQYEPDDGKMLARYAELGGGQGKLGDSAPEHWWREVLCAYARTDLDRLVELYAEDWVYADHRQLGWDEMRGQQDVRGFWRSALELTSSQYGEIDEVVACDERVIAVRLTWHGAANDGGGQLALPLCNVSVIENGRAVITEQYGPEETDALLSRYAELGGDLTVVLGDRPAERLFADRVRRFNAHDVDGSLALVCDDFAYCDHRTISTPDMRGREPLAQLIASIFDIAPGVRMDLEEVIASDGTVIAVRTAYRGGSAGPGIGDYEVVNTEVWLMREGTFAECHLFGADDRQAAIARYAELGGGLAKLGRTKPERWWYEYAQHYAAGDRDAVLAMHADGILLDHRELGWESTPAVDEVMAIIDGALAGTSDIRIEVDEVLASDERACALRITWRGTEASHGGLWEVPMGVVTAIEDGRSTHNEQFQPDDRQAMLARYRELAEQRPVLRWIESYLRAWNAHDLDAVVAHLAEAYVHHDQRRLGLWGSVRGRDAWRREIRPTFSAGSDARLQCTEVLAHDEQVAACIWSFTGTWRGGPYESTMAMLLTVEDGLLTESEFLDPEDRQAVIARYAELGGGRGPLGDRPPEQHVAEFIKRHARHDIDGMLELYRSDAVIVDHRGIGWEEVRGHQGLRELTRSAYDAAWDLHVEIDEVLACDDRVIAMLWTWRASTSTDGGGAIEIPVGRVAIVDNGKFVRIDQYDPDDRAAMMARYAELGGPREVLGDSPVERLVAEASRSFNEHDFDRHLLQHAEDFVLVDHRSIGWSEVRGRQAFGELVRSALAASADVRFDIDEVIASDGERVIALRGAWRSEGSGKAGAWEIPIGYVTVFKNGLLASHDFYEYDDTYAMRARFAELSGGSHPRGTASDDAFNRRDVDAMAESYAEDVVLVDHRRAGWDSVEGREAVLEQATSIWQHMSDDIQVVSQEVIAFDGRVFARIASYRGTARDGGGELDLALGQVGLMSGNQISRLEWFEPSDRWAMTARYAELGGGVAALGDRPPERVYAEFLRRWAAGDTEKILELCAEDYVHVDHRHLGWEPVETREGFRQFVTSVIGATSGFHCNVDEVLACDERLIAMRTTWRGHSTETASELEFKFGYVVIAEQGLVVRQDYYNHDDTDGMLSRYAELGGTRELRGERPPERFWARFVERFDAHDVDALLALRSADWVQVDHRQLGWGESRGRAAAEQLIRSAFAASPDVRLKIDEVIACDDRVSVIVGAWRGSNVDGGGDVAIPIGVVAVIENGTLQREELYEPEQRQEMIARYVELGGGAGPLGDRAPERWWKQFQSAYASGDVDRLIELQADDLENADHRGLAWEQLHGKEDIARFWASPFEVSDSIHVDVEQLLACDDRVIAVLVTYRGTGKDGGGQFSIPLGSVSVIENGRRVSMDIYESDDRERMLARFAELSAPAPVRIMTEYLRCLTAGDLEGALTVVADDFQLTDRRDLALWDDLRGHDGIQRLWASFNDPEIKVRGDLARVIACDEHIIAHTVRLSGTAIQAGDYELELGSVSVFEGGKWMRCEMYEPTDVRGMLARYAELTSTTEPEPPPLRAMREYVRYWDAADADAASAMFAEDVTILDHRRVGGDPIVGREAHRAFLSGAFELSPDNQMRIDDVIACDERVVAVCTTFGGTSPATGGGRAEVSLVQVRVYEGGLFTRSEMFEPDDRRAIVARYAELGGGTSRLGNRPPEQQVKKYATLFAGRDVEGLLQLHDEHWTLTDHRQLAWDEAQGLEQMAEILRSGFELSTDMRLEVDEVLACDERAIAMRVTWRGTAVDGGGQLDYPLGLVIVVEDGRAISHDQYDHDDTDAILARFAELSGPSRSVAAMD